MALEQNEVPSSLYKIISLRNWHISQHRQTVALSAEDDAFIHFSTEAQLDRILTKYWSDVPQVVILKIDPTQLAGRLVYETNPGGNTKYFHLYEGVIPLYSILESKTIYHTPLAVNQTDLLEIVQLGDPVLRKPARELSIDEILSPEIQNLIERMKATMRVSGVGLAAPQIGKSLQLIVLEDMDHSHLTPQQLVERQRSPVPFHVVINPHLYIEKEAPQLKFFEGCLSIGAFLAVVPRAESVRVECLNERAEHVVIHAHGWYARMLQHEIDHLRGVLYIDRMIRPTFMSQESYIKFWKDKTVQEALSGVE